MLCLAVIHFCWHLPKHKTDFLHMEAGTIFGTATPWNLKRPSALHRSSPTLRLIINIKASSSSDSHVRYKGPKSRRDWVADWVSNNDDTVRSLPIYIGGAALLAVLCNRAVSGIAPVADASSSQSRADLLTLGLAVTNILAGLVWLTIRPKSISPVNPQGVECRRISSGLSETAISELLWVWKSVSTATCCRSLVVVYDCCVVLQIGVAAESSNDGEALVVDAAKLIQQLLCRGVMKTGAQSYLANLSLYPGRSELPFLPPNTQAVILQPLGKKGILIIGGDTIRGFTSSDQAWVTFLGEKLDATLENFTIQSRVQNRV